ncbi:MAG: c-type cytochrome [Proteobacteria bacterium]|jgi:S-disulfanyl-L-cysteine oxidoreductase SoxD|nr:c-type cytochrome [Pseudomonadota bacterium]
MFMYRNILVALTLGSTAALAAGPNLGIPVTQDDIAAWDINVLPDGTGLPPGSGTAAQGSDIFAVKCAWCHGVNGVGGTHHSLVGGEPLKGMGSSKTIYNFWPYATTIFDLVRRSMPYIQPRTLSNEEVYALTAYILAINDLIDEKDVMNAETLPQVQMPNRDGFVYRFPELMP